MFAWRNGEDICEANGEGVEEGLCVLEVRIREVLEDAAAVQGY